VGIKGKRDNTNGEVIRSEGGRIYERFNKFQLLPELRARLTDRGVQNEYDVGWYRLAFADH